MRRGYDNKLWIDDDGTFIGVSLGADFTSEHEWGIDSIRSKFKIPDGLGIERRQITVCPQKLLHMTDDEKQISYIFFSNWWREVKTVEDVLTGIGEEVVPIQEKSGIGSAWDSSSFGIAFGADTRKYVPELMEAFKDLDVMIGFAGRGGPFSNPGLFLGIVSRLPKDWVQDMYDADFDLKARNDHPDNEKIKKVLKEAGKGFYALSPEWADDDRKDLKWWLNPRDQQEYNHGWYKIKDLELWAKDQGPIPKGAE